MSEPQAVDFDRQSAWLRRFESDVGSNLKAFALRLKEAMPEHVEILEDKPFFGAPKLRGVSLDIGENKYTLESAKGRLRASKAMIVRGITLNTKSLDPAEWFAELSAETQKTAEHAKSLSQSIAAFMAS
jgi:hypothetical protein